MLNTIASNTGFLILVLLFGAGMLGSLLLNKSDRAANVIGNVAALIGSLWGLLFAGSILATGKSLLMHTQISSFSPFSLTLHIDKLAAFFILVICLIALFCSLYAIGYVKNYYRKYNIGSLGFFYNAFIAGMLLVVTAANGIFFLLAWEIMSLASYFLVVYDRGEPKNIKAGYLYLTMTHVGAAFMMLAFMLLYLKTGSFDFSVIHGALASVSPAIKDISIGLLLVGLGTKAGVIPLHIWLPSAHPAAPSHVSALMSGVMIKTGIYFMIRILFDTLAPVSQWWGITLLVLGAVSAVLGVLYALTEHDIKRLLAYHSIENIGIILLGLGASLVFAANHQNALAIAALIAALFHTLNHAVFKSLLFLSAGSVIHATHTRNIEKYGGLIKLMPVTALTFLIGSMAISALPPFNGFFSEWITFQSLFSGIWKSGDSTIWVFVFAVAALALTGGLALACFVKAFGITFLARSRSTEAEKAKESSRWMQTSMLGVAALCILIGLFAGQVIAIIRSTAQQLSGLSANSAVTTSPQQTVNFSTSATSVSGLATMALLLAGGLIIWFLVRYGINQGQKTTYAPTWDCGTPLNGRMEITATGFAQSIIRVFNPILRTTTIYTAQYDDPTSPAPTSQLVSTTMHDVYQSYLYQPIYATVNLISRWVKMIQNGNLNMYLLYIFVALLIALVIGR